MVIRVLAYPLRMLARVLLSIPNNYVMNAGVDVDILAHNLEHSSIDRGVPHEDDATDPLGR